MFKISAFSRKNLKWWSQHQTAIDLDPDFQRTSRVWRDRDKAFLIDSILNGFDIPKIYIADFTRHNLPALNRHGKSYVVIDGKQRLTAIFAFFHDRLPLHRKFVLESQPTRELGGLRWSALKRHHPRIAKIIERYALDVKVIETDDRRKINDVFLRLNKASKALNGAEVRNAMIGQAVDAIRELGANRFFVRKIRFATDRSQERNASAKILLLEYEGGPAETKKKNLDQFVIHVGENGGGRFNRTMRRVKANMDALYGSFQDQDPLLGAQGHLPLYYMFISRLRTADRVGVRDFLESFERQRVLNRNSTSRHDRELDRFDLASRTINDRSSLETRLRIVRSRYAAWRRGRRRRSLAQPRLH